MCHVCNKLEKLVPPPLLTLPVDRDKSRGILIQWSNLADNSNYSTHAELLDMEVDFLKGYISRKGTQLRLEKALLLTTQVLKLSHRWQKNDFLTQFKLFQSSIITEENQTEHRYPTSQWGNWMLYLSLRDSAILTKIKLECENTTKYWLGLIDGFHHFGDSLVITGILARIWKLSSKMVEEFISLVYPTFLFISELLKSSESVRWPEEDWEVPDDLSLWLRITLKLPLEPATLSGAITSLATNTARTSDATRDLFFLDTTGTPTAKTEGLNKSFESFASHEAEEDTGVPISRSQVMNKKINKQKRRITEIESSSQSPQDQEWRAFKKYWRKFFLNIDLKLKSPKGRKLIVKRIEKFRTGTHVNKKIRIRLSRLMREVRDIQGHELTNAINAFTKFQKIITAETKRLKTDSSQ